MRAKAAKLLSIAAVLLGWLPASQAQPARGAAPSATGHTHLYTLTHPAMATVWTLSVYSANAAQAATVGNDVFDEIDRVEQLLSNYRDSSELSRINREAAAGPVTTDPETMDFLTQSLHWSQVSDGAFDITVGSLMKSWGFFRHRGAVPPASELERLRAVTGWQQVELDVVNRTVRFRVPGVELDPGGIGKGFAVDAAVRVLRSDGVRAALLSAGGSTLYGLGAPPGRRGWRVVIPGPLPSHRTLAVAMLRDESLSSADCTQKNFVADGHRYCHIMDPRTLRPVEGRVQVSVVYPSATASDALSNVLFVDTPEQGAQTLGRSAPPARALVVTEADGQVQCSLFRWSGTFDGSRCAVKRPQSAE